MTTESLHGRRVRTDPIGRAPELRRPRCRAAAGRACDRLPGTAADASPPRAAAGADARYVPAAAGSLLLMAVVGAATLLAAAMTEGRAAGRRSRWPSAV